MKTMLTWLNKHTYQIHILAFCMMILAGLLLYPATKSGQVYLIVLLISIFSLANILELLIR